MTSKPTDTTGKPADKLTETTEDGKIMLNEEALDRVTAGAGDSFHVKTFTFAVNQKGRAGTGA